VEYSLTQLGRSLGGAAKARTAVVSAVAASAKTTNVCAATDARVERCRTIVVGAVARICATPTSRDTLGM
jgi:hypothetical protein